MPGPRKPDYTDRIIQVTQSNFKFLLTDLWGPNGQALRDYLITTRDEAALRDRLVTSYKIEVEANSRLLIVDIAGARTNSFVTDASQQDFYVLVLPPKPRRTPPNDPGRYEEMQAWMTAHYHAINDSYGM